MAAEDRHHNLRVRTKAYASRIIHLYVQVQQAHHFNDAAPVLAKQLLRSATSVAANHREAKHTRSKADRLAKFHIILQELEECALWLESFSEHAMAPPDELRELLDETNQLIGIFITSIRTLREQ